MNIQSELEAALSASASRTPNIREEALDSLLEIFDKVPARSPHRRKILDCIRSRLEDKDSMARCRAVEVLGEIGTKQDVPSLVRMTTNQPWTIRASAYSALAGVGQESALNAIVEGFYDRNPIVRRYAAVAAYDLVGCSAVELLRPHAKRFINSLARVALLHVLGACGDSVAIDELRELAKVEDPHISSPARDALEEIVGLNSG